MATYSIQFRRFVFCLALLICSACSHADTATSDLSKLLSQASDALANQDKAKALDHLQHAQHLIHKEYGVLSLHQRPLLEHMAMIHLSEANFSEANRLMKFQHHITIESNRDAPEQLAPAWEKLGIWYQDTLQPRKARRALEQALTVMQQHHLPFLEQVDVHLALLKNQYLSASCCDIEKVKADIGDHQLTSDQWLKLGDMATLANEFKLAKQFYQNSNQTLAATPIGVRSIDTMSRNYIRATMQRRGSEYPLSSLQMSPTRLVGSPLPLCEARVYDLSDREAYTDYKIDLVFDVTEEGQIKAVSIKESTAHRSVNKLVKQQLRAQRYRPALIDGETTATTLEVTQQFDRLAKPGPAEHRAATRLGCIATARYLEQDVLVADVM